MVSQGARYKSFPPPPVGVLQDETLPGLLVHEAENQSSHAKQGPVRSSLPMYVQEGQKWSHGSEMTSIVHSQEGSM